MKKWLIKWLGGFTALEVAESRDKLFGEIQQRLKNSRMIDSYQRQYVLYGEGEPDFVDMFALDLPNPSNYKEKIS